MKPLTTIKEVVLYAEKRIAKLEQTHDKVVSSSPQYAESVEVRKLELELLLMEIRGEE